MVFVKRISKDLQVHFEFLSRSKHGQTLLGAFLPHFTQRQIHVTQLTPKTAALLSSRATPAAVFFYDGTTKIIFCDFTLERGLLAPLLFHEMVHALDGQYSKKYHEVSAARRAYGEQVSQKMEHERIFAAELIAYTQSYE